MITVRLIDGSYCHIEFSFDWHVINGTLRCSPVSRHINHLAGKNICDDKLGYAEFPPGMWTMVKYNGATKAERKVVREWAKKTGLWTGKEWEEEE